MKTPNKAQLAVHRILAHESISDREIQRYLSGVKPRPGLKRYSTAQLIRFLRRRAQIDRTRPPEPPGEPHQIVREALDPDEPDTVLRTHPGFEIRTTMYMAEMVFVKGEAAGEETDTDWPWKIGNVVEGPGHRWYVIDVHGLPQEDLGNYRLGVHDGAQTFDTKEDAATALWLLWRRLPEHPLRSLRRRNKSASKF